MENITEEMRTRVEDKLPDFLLAEYEHMSDSFLRNEESGEKRAAFFVTLVGASGGILGFVFSEKAPNGWRDHILLAIAVVALVLLFLGILTVKRLIKRDIETDRIKFALRTLRRLFLTQEHAEAMPNAFFDPYTKPTLRSVEWFSIGNGGWLHTVAFVNALLTVVFVFAACLTPRWAVAWEFQIIIGLVLALAGGFSVWMVQLNIARSIVVENQEKLLKAEPLGLKERVKGKT